MNILAGLNSSREIRARLRESLRREYEPFVPGPAGVILDDLIACAVFAA
jgi:hypothetical protein